GGFENALMREQRALDLEGRDIDAADLEHVVGASAIGEIAVLAFDVFVAAARPLAEEGRAAALAIVPVEGGAGRAGDLELADLARLDRRSRLVDEADAITGNRLPGRAVAHRAGPVRQEDVEHLGRADAVEDGSSGARFP